MLLVVNYCRICEMPQEGSSGSTGAISGDADAEDRVDAYLNPQTRGALIGKCRGLLTCEHSDEMWEISQSLRRDEDLQRMFPLLCHFLISGGTYAYLTNIAIV
ncbi:uncharacterized protein LACBIDRAFT_298269 [Laccaria bicolor S238N-H82]|uniref:Predicted protein n=1 Tax=Laccaria bicolor (strain S238N-H82 / ATCC MYA-4686) TaxID=486041 RepID=B0DCL9_LACBS|nr:uncharacterized protein LACBIDRAFT_298269 [Laccaria bicolor S238N-H82]EDR07921.1 predicted protein [Laccaria bicolor S238N-H82]|eukprot:XP_001881710.1 predicted protein [Laccaria bicolor S238N-H82]